MVEPRRFKKSDLNQVQEWAKARGAGEMDESLLSSTGMIVDGVAAGFLYLTNSRAAIIDGYISNPNSLKLERDQALNAITKGLLELARACGAKFIKCDSQLPAIQQRALANGFKSVGIYAVFTQEL